MKKYKLTDNISFLASVMRQASKASFVFVLLRIPLEVIIPYIGIWFPNLIVRAIGESVNRTHLFTQAAILGGLLVVLSLVNQYGKEIVSAESAYVRMKLTDMLNDHLMDCSYDMLGDKKVMQSLSQASQRIWSNTGFLVNAGENTVAFFSAVAGVVVYLAVLSKLPFWVILLLIAATVVSFLTSGFGEKIRQKRNDYFGENVSRLLELSSEMSDAAKGKDVRLYQMHPWVNHYYNIYNKKLNREYGHIAKWNFISDSIGTVLSFAADAVVYLCLTAFAMQGKITIAEYVLYIGAATGFTAWVRQVTGLLQRVWKVNGDLSCVRTFLDTDSREEEQGQSIPSGGWVCAADVLKKGDPCEVEFDRVSYRYPNNEKDTLKELSFKIKAGEKIGLVGMNGAGKSTLIKLLCRLIRPTSGHIRINGVDITSMKRTECYKLFSTVFQDLHIFPVSIKNNIVWDGQVDEAYFAQCLEQADLAEWVSSLKEKENTKLVQELEEGAVNLSGGQSQKLLLARALYKNAPILLLDEPTAALDPIAESNIYEKYNQLSAHKTSIFISHRLASTRFCDRIFLMEDGRIAEEGTHEELLKKAGSYAKMFEVQRQYYV